jgi:hypothetical protein
MPGSEAIPMSRLSLFYGWSLVVGGWSPALPPIVGDAGTQLLGEPATDLAWRGG